MNIFSINGEAHLISSYNDHKVELFISYPNKSPFPTPKGRRPKKYDVYTCIYLYISMCVQIHYKYMNERMCRYRKRPLSNLKCLRGGVCVCVKILQNHDPMLHDQSSTVLMLIKNTTNPYSYTS